LKPKRRRPVLLTAVNLVCIVATAIVCLNLYHIAEETRLARVQLDSVQHRIADEQNQMVVLQAEWAKMADPARIQRLATAMLGANDTPAIELSSYTMLPKRGADQGPDGAQLRSASAPANPGGDGASLHLVAMRLRD